MDQLFPAFLDEARLLLGRMGRSLRALLERNSTEEFDHVFQSVHTLKSSSRMVGLQALGGLLHDVETDWERARGNPSHELIEKSLHLIEAIQDAIQDGTVRERRTAQALRALWGGKGLPVSTHLRIPPDVHLSPLVYEHLMGATESVLSAKMKVEAIGNSLLRTLERIGKNEVAIAGEYQSAQGLLHRATIDLETSVRDARMTPLSVFFDRLPMLARDVGSALGKDVTLFVSGGDLQADRLVIGELGGALGHLVRNAVDHGLSRGGTIRVSAREDEGHLLVSIEDDGQGIPYEALERIAKERGLIDRDAVLSDEARKELLFHPHLSTTTEVTEISGRGVGMSAVREYVRSVGGGVVVESPLPLGGTRVVMRIPTSLSLMRILLVRAGHGTFGIPMHDVRETVPFDEQTLHQEEGSQMVRIREEVFPFLPLSRMLSLDGGYWKKGNPLLLRIDTPHGDAVVYVDAVLHEEEVLVKMLPKILSPLSAFRGAAMVGDGRTILILDAGGLARVPVPPPPHPLSTAQRLSPLERDQLMEIMNMVASHAGGALARRVGSHIELSVPECADGTEVLPEEDWGASSIGVRMDLEGEYPGKLLFEIPATLSERITRKLHAQQADLHNLSEEERSFFQELGQIAMHAVGNMLSTISKHPVMTKMSDIRVDARGALRTYFLSGHESVPDDLVRVRLWFGVGDGIRTDDHRETGSLTMEFSRGAAKKLLRATSLSER